MSGVLTRDEILTTVIDLNEARDVAPRFVALVDLSAVTSTLPIRADDVRDLAAVPLTSVSRVAFVAPDVAMFGLARMCAALRELSSGWPAIGVFRSTREADAWVRPSSPNGF